MNIRIEQKLLSDVQKFLKNSYQIHVNIPPLKHLLDSKINLKHIQSGNGQQNRYNQIIHEADTIFNLPKLTLLDIQEFMSIFLKCVNNDIEVMQKNEGIRLSAYNIREKILFRTEQIANKKDKLIENSQKIHDKQDILNFVAMDLKNYLTVIKLISQDYQSIKNVEILTPLRIDNIYQPDSITEEDYFDHYGPLLQVLVRLRSNMTNLHHETEHASKADMPLKAVNLLANCKSLLLELEPFLISDHCAFNRLIFYVVSQQNDNMRILANFYKQNLTFVRDAIFSSYKSIFLGHIFSDYFHEFEIKIERSQTKVIETLLESNSDLNSKDITLSEYKKNLNKIQYTLGGIQKQVKGIRDDIRLVKKVICFEKNRFMREYVEEKICKKLGLLLKIKGDVLKLQVILNDSEKYLRDMYRIAEEKRDLLINTDNLQRATEFISRDPTLTDKMNQMAVSSGEEKSMSSLNSQKQKIFRENFLKIQDSHQKLYAIKICLQNHQQQCNQPQLQQKLFPPKIKEIQGLKETYLDLQTKLINSFQHLLVEKEQKQLQAVQISDKTLKQANQFLSDDSGVIRSTLGYEILNQDDLCQQTKAMLIKIDKAEYLLKSYHKSNKSEIHSSGTSKNNHKNYQEELQQYRKCLQWLLVIFEGSMDQKIFESFIDKMDYTETHPQGLKKNCDKVNELLAQIHKYLGQLNKISKQISLRNRSQSDDVIQNNGPKIFNKIYRISKQRLTLYKILEELYHSCLVVYSELLMKEENKSYEISKKGIRLFDKGLYQYVLTYYQCKNKIGIFSKQLADINILIKAKNYICDDIYEPYVNRLHVYLGSYSESELLNLVLRLEDAMVIGNQYQAELEKIEAIMTMMAKGGIVGNGRKELVQSLRACAQKLCGFRQKGQMVIQISKKKFVVHNMGEFSKIMDDCHQHFIVAEIIDERKDLSSQAIKNPSLKKAVEGVHAQFREELVYEG